MQKKEALISIAPARRWPHEVVAYLPSVEADNLTAINSRNAFQPVEAQASCLAVTSVSTTYAYIRSNMSRSISALVANKIGIEVADHRHAFFAAEYASG